MVRSVDLDAAGNVIAVVTRSDGASPELRRFAAGTGADAWALPLATLAPGPCAFAADQVVVAVGGAADVDLAIGPIALRGEPGAAVVAVDATAGTLRWQRPLRATAWVVVTAIASSPDGKIIVGGSFAGTLRIGDQLVSSAGNSDGFVAQLGATGDALWITRVGGDGADAVISVAVDDAGIAIAGSFLGQADLRGQQLLSPMLGARVGTGFVATLASADGLPRWTDVVGGMQGTSVIAVRVTTTEVIGVANIAGEVDVGSHTAAPRGKLGILVARWARPTGAVIVDRVFGGSGGARADGAALVQGDILVGGSFTGSMALGHGDISADGDDALLARIGGADIASSVGTGPGRETVTALASSVAGAAVALHHTAALTFQGHTYPTPHEAAGGAVLVFEPPP